MVFALLSAGAALLGAAGLAKLRDPSPARQAVRSARIPGGARVSTLAIRLVGLSEFGIAIAAAGGGGRLAAGLLAGTYLILVLGAGRLLAIAPDTDCGCFGRSGSTISRWHLVVNCGFLLVGLTAVSTPTASMRVELSRQPLFGGALALAALLLAWLCYLMMAALPELQAARQRIGAIR